MYVRRGYWTDSRQWIEPHLTEISGGTSSYAPKTRPHLDDEPHLASLYRICTGVDRS